MAEREDLAGSSCQYSVALGLAALLGEGLPPQPRGRAVSCFSGQRGGGFQVQGQLGEQCGGLPDE